MNVKTTPKSILSDRPSLWELAGQVSERRPIPASDPRPHGYYRGGPALRLHNQMLKVSLWGPPQALTWSLNKTDVWDRRYFPEKPLPLSKISAGVKTGDWPERYYKSCGAYDFPCPKPVGQVIIQCTDLAGAKRPEAKIKCADAQVEVRLKKAAARASIKSLTMMTRNLLIIEGNYRGIKNPVSIRLYRHCDVLKTGESHFESGTPIPIPDYDYTKDTGNGPLAPPTAGQEGKFFWLRQQMPAERTFPDGFEYVLMARVLGAPYGVATIEGETGLGTPPFLDDSFSGECYPPRYEPLRAALGATATATLTGAPKTKFSVLVTVVTTAESADPFAEARRRLRQAEHKGIAGLKAENRQWWQKFYQLREDGRIIYPDKARNQEVVRETFRSWPCFHTSGTCPDPFKFECDSAYAYMEQDWSPWHGDNHFNEAEYGSAFVQSRIDRLDMWLRIGEFLLPLARKNAADIYGCRGAAYALCYVPIKSEDIYHGSEVWEQSMEMTAQLAKMFWQRYQFTGDREFLQKRAYPILQAGARFYADYLTEGKDGLFHVIPTVSAEHWGLTKDFERNHDSISALSLIKYHLRAAGEAARILGADEKERARWLSMADRLAPYPIYDTRWLMHDRAAGGSTQPLTPCYTAEGPIFVDVRGAPPIKYNCPPPLYPATLGDDINLDSEPVALATMLRTIRKISCWPDRVKRARIVLAMDEGCDPEQLLNCRSGRIRIFPAAPKGLDVAFQRFLAIGAFEVTAERKKDMVVYLAIRSRSGNPCHLVNPWPGADISITDTADGRTVDYETVRMRDDGIRFGTKAGHTYIVHACERKCRPLDICRQANMGFADRRPVPRNRGGIFGEKRNLVNFPLGRKKFCNALFRIITPAQNAGRGCVVLKGRSRPDFPEKALGIEVKRKIKRLYFLHTASYCGQGTGVVYRIRLNYADRSNTDLEVKEGETIWDWYYNMKPGEVYPPQTPQAKAAWIGKVCEWNEPTKEAAAIVFCAWLTNPHPERKVMTLDLISGDSRAVPAIFGITAE